MSPSYSTPVPLFACPTKKPLCREAERQSSPGEVHVVQTHHSTCMVYVNSVLSITYNTSGIYIHTSTVTLDVYIHMGGVGGGWFWGMR